MFLIPRVRRRYFSKGEKRRPELTSVVRRLQTFLLEKRRPSGEERVETVVFAGCHETGLSLTHFIFDSASNYSRRSLHHVPFLVSFVSWFVLIDLDMSIQSCAIGCILHFFPWYLADTGIQFSSVYLYTRALKSSRSLPGSYLVCSPCLWSYYSDRELFSVTFAAISFFLSFSLTY